LVARRGGVWKTERKTSNAQFVASNTFSVR
jgi:hypothetical protein